jgi:hypothetical protein
MLSSSIEIQVVLEVVSDNLQELHHQRSVGLPGFGGIEYSQLKTEQLE